MAYYADLSPYEYALDEPPDTVNIGWLEPRRPYPTGTTPEAFRARLRDLCGQPMNLTIGYHTCLFCQDGQPARGSGEIRVSGDGKVYAAPALVHHYVEAHGYKPPEEFIEAVANAASHSLSDAAAQDLGKGPVGAGPTAPSSECPVGDPGRPAAATPWLPWIWIAGGVYLVFRSGWPPHIPIFTIGACFAIGIGVGLWFVERYEAFRPWRVLVRYVLLGVALAALGAAIVWDAR
jgi:hypothetical protein